MPFEGEHYPRAFLRCTYLVVFPKHPVVPLPNGCSGVANFLEQSG
jgi:hypothetical protein